MQKKRNIFRHCLNHKNLRSCDNGNLSKLIQIYHERSFDINFDVGIYNVESNTPSDLLKKSYISALFKPSNINLFHPSVAFHIETNHLICTANQITVFYLKCNTSLK